MRSLIRFLILLTALAGGARAEDRPFAKGLPRSPRFFPLAVWLQDPANAERYRAIGINTYVGLWRGPTEAQLDLLDKAGIRLICGQNPRSMAFKDRPTIAGWMHGDEPDNAQALPRGQGRGYGPPIPPSQIVASYERIRRADPDRPVILNLGQGVAWDGWYGRGVRTNHPEDYPEYVKGCDIASFDIYPASHDRKEIAGNLWYVPHGVDRLRRWCGDRKEVWCCIETTRISNPEPGRKPTPEQIQSEVWMALIHGAKGLIYFAHQFKPSFIEAGLLADDEMARAVGDLNRQVLDLAPALNSPDVSGELRVTSSDPSVPVDVLVKRVGDTTYVFSSAMREGPTTATFALSSPAELRVDVIGEGRRLAASGGKWTDRFTGYQVHLYRIAPARSS
jgi:hypothetical protein